MASTVAYLSQGRLLVKEPDKPAREIGKNVLSYDLAASGDIIFSNGSAIFTLGKDGRREKLCDDGLIEAVVFVE
ncbi:MAG: hypothetical protein L0211_13500 [Planctomycetaceae bacterium]|nr:hypothetical protein [Planctomycetaceae bacterium]